MNPASLKRFAFFGLVIVLIIAVGTAFGTAG